MTVGATGGLTSLPYVLLEQGVGLRLRLSDLAALRRTCRLFRCLFGKEEFVRQYANSKEPLLQLSRRIDKLEGYSAALKVWMKQMGSYLNRYSYVGDFIYELAVIPDRVAARLTTLKLDLLEKERMALYFWQAIGRFSSLTALSCSGGEKVYYLPLPVAPPACSRLRKLTLYFPHEIFPVERLANKFTALESLALLQTNPAPQCTDCSSRAFALPLLTELRCTGWSLSAPFLEDSCRVSSGLRHLSLEKSSLSEEAFRFICKRRWHTLHLRALGDKTLVFDSSCLALLEPLGGQVTSLDLSYSTLIPPSFWPPFLEKWTQLKHLALSGTTADAHAFKSAAVSNPRLETARFNQCSRLEASGCLLAIAPLKQLRKLYLSGVAFSHEQARRVAQVSSLTALTISGEGVDASWVKCVALRLSLRKLAVSHAPYFNEEALALLSTCGDLRRVWLGPKIGARRLESLQGIDALERLTIDPWHKRAPRFSRLIRWDRRALKDQ